MLVTLEEELQLRKYLDYLPHPSTEIEEALAELCERLLASNAFYRTAASALAFTSIDLPPEWPKHSDFTEE